MKRIQLQIKAISPLAIGRHKPGNSISEVEQYIPGTVIRGAIAAQILKQARPNDKDLSQNGGDFQTLFLGENPAIFQNAYPATLDSARQTRIQSEVSIIPATALSSKDKPGFKLKDDDPKHNGVFDTLIDRFCAESHDLPYDPNCPTDKGRVDVFTGFYSCLNKKYYQHSADTRLLTRVGINRRRATSEDQLLYSIEVLNESQVIREKPVIYTGIIWVNDETLANHLQQFINNHKEDLRLGGSISRGLGKVKITANNPINPSSQLKSRSEQFNTKLRERWKTWKVFSNLVEELPEARFYFTLDLQSDAILTKDWRRTTVISKKMLEDYTNMGDSSLELHTAYSSYDYRSGWNAAWGLMKDVELVTNKGAVYLFSIDTSEKEKWIQALEKLEITGVGERTCEGFGQVQVCNEFHLIVREEAK